MLHVTRSITISNEIPQIWDYFNGGIACLLDTVNQQQLKVGLRAWDRGDTRTLRSVKEQLTYHIGKIAGVPFVTQFNCIISLEALD